MARRPIRMQANGVVCRCDGNVVQRLKKTPADAKRCDAEGQLSGSNAAALLHFALASSGFADC